MTILIPSSQPLGWLLATSRPPRSPPPAPLPRCPAAPLQLPPRAPCLTQKAGGPAQAGRRSLRPRPRLPPTPAPAPSPHLCLDDVPGVLQPHVVLRVVQEQALLQVLLGVLIHLSGEGRLRLGLGGGPGGCPSPQVAQVSRERRPRRLMGEACWGPEVTPVRAEHFRREQGPSEAETAQGPQQLPCSQDMPPTGHAAPWPMTSHLPCWPCGNTPWELQGAEPQSRVWGHPSPASCLPSPTSALSITLAHNIHLGDSCENSRHDSHEDQEQGRPTGISQYHQCLLHTDAEESLLLTLTVTLPLGVAWETPSGPEGQMVTWFWLP